VSTKLTVDQAAAKLGVTARRVRQLIGEGILPAAATGEGRRKTWLIEAGDLEIARARKTRRGPAPRQPGKAVRS